jgi:hypothetical protein
MALSEAFANSQTVGAGEWSMPNDAAYSAAAAKTDDGVFQVFLDLSALADGDTFRFAAYEKVLAASTQRRFFSQEISNAQGTEDNWVSPSFLLLHGWDFTLQKVTGTDRNIDWSIRKVA